MKYLAASFLLFCLQIAALVAEDKQFPPDGAQKYTLTLPDKWESEVDTDGSFAASSPDEELSLAAWEVDEKELDDFKNPTRNIDHILRDCVKEIHLRGEPKLIQVGKIPALQFEGSGSDADDNSLVDFHALILRADPKHITVLFLESDSQVAPARRKMLEDILASVRPA